MTHPPDHPTAAGHLRRPLQDLSAIERWAGHIGAHCPPDGTSEDGTCEGAEFDVDTMTRTGMHQVTGITPRRQGGSDPAREPAEAERAVLRSSVRALLDMAGHESGPARTVVALTPQGACVLSCRLRGDVTVSEPQEDPPTQSPGQGPVPLGPSRR
ncbi:hypothetical protein [Streptomyces sp. NPDC051364]|uniref:hypothetical protein n=1 Tax=Streptomyces sp. NPDC051364 TaxID=3155799 RepID=UPI0034413EB9